MTKMREEIRNLMESLVAMADDVGVMLSQATRAFSSPAQASVADMAQRDRGINRMENVHDTRCLRILALYQPEADDLRTVFMALRINSDLERIADHSLNVVERSEIFKAPPPEIFLRSLDRMGILGQGMLRDSITAFVARDSALAKSVILRDDEADDLLKKVFTDVIAQGQELGCDVETLLAVVLAAKELERVADLCTNVAEDVVFMAEGELLRHQGEV